MLIITKEFRKELKNAETVSFSSINNIASLRLHTKDGYSKETFLERRDYTTHKDSWFNDMTVISGWQALYYIIKPGDKLYFYVGSNQSTNLNEAGLFNDQLNCKIIRKDKEIVSQYLLGYSISANNTARAIKAA